MLGCLDAMAQSAGERRGSRAAVACRRVVSPDPESNPQRLTRAAFAGEFAAAVPALLAWAQLRLRPELRRLLEPEDLVQEVGCRAFTSLDDFDGARGTFRQWLFGFGSRVLLEALRQAGRGRSPFVTPLADPGVTDAVAVVTTVTERVAREEVVRMFLARIEGLDEGDRDLLLHRGLEGMPHTDLARLLGVSDEVLRKRWSRLCERMRHDPVFAKLAAS